MNSPIAPPDVLQLLHSFDFRTLGEGNEAAGMNTLVGMTCAISAAAGWNAGIRFKDGSFARIGMNWMTAGGLTSEISRSCVLSPIARYQNNLLEAIKPHRELRQKAANLKPLGRPADINAKVMHELQQHTIQADLHTQRDLREEAGRLLAGRKHENDSLLLERAGFYFVGGNPDLLSSQLPSAHGRYPLVDLPVSDINGIALNAPVAGAIMDGFVLPGTVPIHLSGLIVSRMPRHALTEAIAADKSHWPFRLLWLVDDPLGVDAKQHSDAAPKLNAVQARYDRALHAVLEHRLRHDTGLIKHLSFPARGTAELIQHLGTLEPHVPGITGALRPLFATLIFGMLLMVDSAEMPKGFQISPEAVLGFAKFLATRTAYAAFLARQSDNIERTRAIAARLLEKLADGPHTATQLTRRTHKLLIDDCRAGLTLLLDQGLVERREDEWVLVPTPPAALLPGVTPSGIESPPASHE